MWLLSCVPNSRWGRALLTYCRALPAAAHKFPCEHQPIPLSLLGTPLIAERLF
jgi:hypothetical protein